MKLKDACSLEGKLWQPIQHIEEQRPHIDDNSTYSQSYGFPVNTHRCECWTIKKAEHQRTHAFKLWCWRRFLRVHWNARPSNESILKEINPEYSLEGLALKLLSFGHLMWRADSLEKTLMLGKIEGRRRRGQQRMRWWDSITGIVSLRQWTWVWANPGR